MGVDGAVATGADVRVVVAVVGPPAGEGGEEREAKPSIPAPAGGPVDERRATHGHGVTIITRDNAEGKYDERKHEAKGRYDDAGERKYDAGERKYNAGERK